MYKKLLALSLALVLCVCPVFAVSDADNSYYSFEPVSYGSLGGRPLATLAVSSGWSDTDHDYLNQIRLALTSKNTGTLLSYVISIKDTVSKSFDQLFSIKQNAAYLPNISNNTNEAKSLLNQIELNTRDRAWTSEQAVKVTSSADSLSSFLPDLRWFLFEQSIPMPFADPSNFKMYDVLSTTTFNLGFDGQNAWTGQWSLYHYVKQLSEVLASDDDKALADAQKPNRDQIEQDFVSGTSGSTSLGASDFGDLSSVGGSVKDSISLNGQSTIGGFTGGLSDANEAGQGWFSASTRDALDTVSPSSSSSSSRARRAPDDIYNMAGFVEHYSWLYGG